MREAVILAAGNAWRLKPNIWTIKPLLKIMPNKTLLDYQIEWLRRYGFDHIIVTTLYDNITEYDVDYSFDEKPLGTSGSLFNARKLLSTDRVYVMNVDDIVYYNPLKLFNSGKEAIILSTHPRIRFGHIVSESDHEISRVRSFIEKPIVEDLIVNVGHYVFDVDILDSYLVERGDLERDVFPRLAKDGKLYRLFIPNLKWLTINNMKDYIRVRNELWRDKVGVER